VVTFFRVLRDQPEDLERQCRLSPYARAEFARADLDDQSIDDMERARRFWVRVNQSFAKAAAKNTGWSTSIKRGSNNARSAANRLDRLHGIAERLMHVTIENRHALDVIADYSAVDGVIYADPPYLEEVRTSFAGGKRPGGDYVHEFATEEEHRALAEALHVTPATVFLSGYPSALYDELYDGWCRLDRRVLRRTTNGRGGATTHVTESLWTNRPVDEGRLPLTSNEDVCSKCEWCTRDPAGTCPHGLACCRNCLACTSQRPEPARD
jgi:DNA adenine methylase